MVKRNNPNVFSELRRHYAELPADYLGPMRLKTLRGYRTLEPFFAQPGQPVVDIITPAGASDASAVERQLTDMLFADKRRRRR